MGGVGSYDVVMNDLVFASLGDSSGVGVGAGNDGGYPMRVAARLQRVCRVRHESLAQSGATSNDVAGAQLKRCVSLAPSLVTVGIGGNDLWRQVSPLLFQKNLEHVVNALVGGDVDVVFLNVVDLSLAPVASLAQQMVGVTPAQIAARVDELNDVVGRVVERGNQKAATAGRGARFFVADVCGPSRRELAAGAGDYFAGDGFHPSMRGYDRIAEIVWPVVEGAVRERRAASRLSA